MYTKIQDPFFKQGKEITDKRPNTLISDEARNFGEAFNREFYTTKPRTDIFPIFVYRETMIKQPAKASGVKAMKKSVNFSGGRTFKFSI